MTPERYAEIQHEFLALRDLTGVERDLRLHEIESRLPDAIDPIKRLLAADLQNSEFLEVPLVDRENQPAFDTTHLVEADIDAVPHPVYVGPFRILQQIGEGGHGVVFMAEQQVPIRRRVAIKWIKPGMDSSLVLARFEAERQALALMSHPSIANVIDAGRTETGQPYFVMELVHGEPIDGFCDTNELGLKERLQVFCQVCEAVHHAHRKGIIHRDIKPSNVLVTVDSGTPLAKVIDFGIAKALHMPLTEKTMFTEYGQILGTLEYMSPEQAMMSQSGIDVRSDVYSLGVLLYVLITGETPLNKQQLLKDGIFELRNVLQEVQPQTPSLKITTNREARRWKDHFDSPETWAKSVQGDLDWITMKALAKQPSRRYDSAAAFALDIQQFLSGEVVAARPPSRIYLFRKWFARHRVMATISAALLGCVLVSTLALWWAFTKSQDNLMQAKEAQATVKAQSSQLEQSLNVSRLETARADASAGKLSRLLQKQTIEAAWDDAISGDFETAAAQLFQIPPNEVDIEKNFVLSVADQMKLPMLRHQNHGTIRRLAVHHASSTLAIVNATSELELFDLERRQLTSKIVIPDLIYSACGFSSDGAELLLASGGAVIRVDLKSKRAVTAVQVAKSSIRGLVHDAVHQQWALTTGANFVYFIDDKTFKQTVAVDLKTRVAEIALAFDSQHVLVAALDGRLLVVPATNPRSFGSVVRKQHKITNINVSPDFVTVVDANGTVQKIKNDDLADLTADLSSKPVSSPMSLLKPTTFKLASIPVSVTFASDGAILTSTGGRIQRHAMDGTVMPLHDVTAKIKQVISIPRSDDVLVVMPSGQVFVLPEATVRVRMAEFQLLPKIVDAVPMIGGEVVVAATPDGELQRWSGTEMALMQRAKVHDAAIFEIDIHDGCQMIASVGDDRQLVISDAVSLDVKHRMKIGWGVRCVQFSNDGSLLAAAPDADDRTGLQEGTVDLWNTKTGRANVRLIGHQNWVLKAAFSGNDELLATLAVDETARVWSTATGQNLAVMRLAGLSQASSMAFHPDGDVLVVGHEDGSLTTWDASSGGLLRQNQLASDQIMSVEFIEGAARLLAVARSQDGVIIVDPDRFETAIRLPIAVAGVVQSRIKQSSKALEIVTTSGRIYFWNW